MKRPCVKHMTRSWRVMTACHFASTSQEMPSCEIPVKLFVWQKWKVLYQILYLHYIYLHYPRNCKDWFSKRKPYQNIWELEIVIPIIIYTFSLGFSLLLPLHLYILERFLTQTLTSTILSVERSFGVFGKYWKKPLSGGCNRAELRDPES